MLEAKISGETRNNCPAIIFVKSLEATIFGFTRNSLSGDYFCEVAVGSICWFITATHIL